MRLFTLSIALTALAFASTGCDSNDLEAGDLEDVQDEFDCTQIRSVGANSETNGTLTESDCDDDDFYFDIYTFRLDEDSDVEIEFESDDFDISVALYDEDPDFITGRSASEGNEGEIETNLDDGVYVVLIGSAEEDELGDYRLKIVSEDD